MTGFPARVESGAFVVTPGAMEMLSPRDVKTCSGRIPEPAALCIGCFLGVMLGGVVWAHGRRKLVKEDR